MSLPYKFRFPLLRPLSLSAFQLLHTEHHLELAGRCAQVPPIKGWIKVLVLARWDKCQKAPKRVWYYYKDLLPPLNRASLSYWRAYLSIYPTC